MGSDLLWLIWTRYWRGTRTQDIRGVVGALNHDAKFAAYHENTLRLIDASEARAPREDSFKDWSIRATYPQFPSPELRLKVRPVRRVAQPTVRADGPASGGPRLRQNPSQSEIHKTRVGVHFHWLPAPGRRGRPGPQQLQQCRAPQLAGGVASLMG